MAWQFCSSLLQYLFSAVQADDKVMAVGESSVLGYSFYGVEDHLAPDRNTAYGGCESSNKPGIKGNEPKSKTRNHQRGAQNQGT